MSDEEIKDEEVKDEQVDTVKEETVKKSEYDKTQQQIDQERANARKARERAEQAERQSHALKQELDRTKEQLDEINEKLNRPPAIDEDAADIPDLVKYAKTLEETIRQHEKDMKVLKAAAEQSRQQASQAAVEKESARLQEQILTDCDEEFGAKFRNEALKMADSLVEKGEVELPKSPLDGYKLMRKCYQKIASSTKKAPATATDSGGSVVPADSGIKPGSRQEVLKQMKKNHGWRSRAG